MTLISWIIILILFKFVAADNGDGDTWEDAHMFCPNQCVCQRSAFMDSSVSHWIQELRRENGESTKKQNENTYQGIFNEAFFEDDESHLKNPYVRFVMCMLQGDVIAKDLVVSLPQDTQALVLLHNGNANHSITVSSTDLLQFDNLEILEIRSTGSNRNLEFFIDNSMPTLKHVNFESIKIIADEKIKKSIKYQHPSETYDYAPEGQRFNNNDRDTMYEEIENGEDAEDEIEIVPYDVYKMELTKSMRPNFFGWFNLEVLRIHNCHLDEVEWEMFAGLENLQHLSLEHNDIKVVPSFAFYGALHLRTLSLANNDILDLNYLALAGLLDLEHLDLSSNNLSKLSEATFPPFPSLRLIDLQNNPIEYILPMTFAVLNTTKELILGSKATALDLANTHGAFLSLDQLKTLNILNVHSPSLYQTLFNGLKDVERLRLKGLIERIEYDTFSEMPHLKELILSGCGIVEISMDAFFGIKDLRIIDLSDNGLSLIPAGVFDEQKKLQEVYLQNNHLENLPNNFFDDKSLKLVRITNNPLVCTCDMMKWNQAITNSIRLSKQTTNRDENCIRNPKTGRIEYCNDQYDDFPQYSYGFDNKMTPLCTDSATSPNAQNVYYILRHTKKCAPATIELNKKKLQKQREQKKLIITLEKLSRTQGHTDNGQTSWSSQQWTNKKIRKMQFEDKVKRTMSKNTQTIHEEVHSNNVAYV
ncbi:leucine-rich repeats and immunoglobulin-like domains protein sma-10 [Contarinia nasturtii]|uniref:leucine-rich repeats and immunoglobulin-like domains protein sma-10 n=1 Tax=Contarinia nasturtii TaxID=265458 RepID=UPI0012D41099|nr:leucine-rich repeats and immunoglobulin-like domains protein sma-10 [Contarinia nasturtii]